MKSFLKYTLATITGIILTSLLFFIMLIASLSAMIAAGEKPVTIKGKNVLHIIQPNEIPDRGNANSLAGFDPMSFTFTPGIGLNDILSNISKAASDDKIAGIMFEPSLMPAGWATADEIRQAMIKFRESGKFIIAYSDMLLTQQGYYISTAADRLYIGPQATMEFKGLSGEVMFFKGALEKLGVNVQILRHGRFKGAVEPFMLKELSEENRKQIESYTGSIWNSVLDDISESRGLTKEALNSAADNLVAYNGTGALESGLIDAILYRDQVGDTLRMLMGLGKDEPISSVTLTKYMRVTPAKGKQYSSNKIAVIYASGTIVPGRGNESSIGSTAYSEEIRNARRDTTIKAIVLRVNSPGGNAISSEIIWRELELASEAKPLVISMGNYAASGGYYISAPADRIVTNRTTLTGSIGVFGMIPDLSGLMEKKLGINTDVVSTNRHSDFPSVFRSLDPYEEKIMLTSVENTYSTFLERVANGRNMENSAVDFIGEGRVWSGAEALTNGLADETGGLNRAIEVAAELAGLDKYMVRELPVQIDPYTKLLKDLSGEVRNMVLSPEMKELLLLQNRVEEIRSMTGIQARLPYFIDIR